VHDVRLCSIAAKCAVIFGNVVFHFIACSCAEGLLECACVKCCCVSVRDFW